MPTLIVFLNIIASSVNTTERGFKDIVAIIKKFENLDNKNKAIKTNLNHSSDEEKIKKIERKVSYRTAIATPFPVIKFILKFKIPIMFSVKNR